MRVPVVKARREDGGWRAARGRHARASRRSHQIGNFADFCNDCGNCDVFCPEDGGPYLVKPRFFGTLPRGRRDRPRDGFFVRGSEEARRSCGGASQGREFRLHIDEGRVRYRGEGFDVGFAEAEPCGRSAATPRCEVDLAYYTS